MALTAAERETTMTVDDEQKVWRVSSYRRTDITKLKKNPDFVIEDEGTFEGTAFVLGTLPYGGIAIRRTSAGTIKKGGGMKAGTCTGKKLDGTPCGALAQKGSDRCKRHPKK